jgi:hypothetical protein
MDVEHPSRRSGKGLTPSQPGRNVLRADAARLPSAPAVDVPAPPDIANARGVRADAIETAIVVLMAASMVGAGIYGLGLLVRALGY